MIIETDRLILRPFAESDAADVFEYLHEPMVHCFACMTTETMEDARKAVLERAKDGTPANSFNISMVPWLEFTAMNINVFDDGKFLLPIFTMGKYFERDGKRYLPLAIQVHHAVCDGYHVGMFVERLQGYVDNF